MNWKKEIDELKRIEALANKMGGEEKLQRQKDNKRLNARERIDLLLDKNSFHEIGKIAGKSEYNDEGEMIKFIPSNFIKLSRVFAISFPESSSDAIFIDWFLYLSALDKTPLTHFPISFTAIVCHIISFEIIPGKIFLDIV